MKLSDRKPTRCSTVRSSIHGSLVLEKVEERAGMFSDTNGAAIERYSLQKGLTILS